MLTVARSTHFPFTTYKVLCFVVTERRLTKDGSEKKKCKGMLLGTGVLEELKPDWHCYAFALIQQDKSNMTRVFHTMWK